MSKNRIRNFLKAAQDQPAEKSAPNGSVPTGFIEISLDWLPLEMRQGACGNQHLYDIAYRQARESQE